jgi:hypothetical protein
MFEDDKKPPPRDAGRDRAWTEIRAKSPLRPRKDQEDHNHLPLFVAANEPTFL